MALIFEPIFTAGIAQISYLIGDSKAGIAAMIDPRRDVDVYLALARERGVKIAYAVETHIHADFASGVHELSARSGAQIAGGQSADYRFKLRQLAHGETIQLGNVGLTALQTPGHTPEHISLLISDSQQGDSPFGAFTGDTLFNLDVGRPDLLGSGETQGMAEALYDSLFEKLIPLGERVEIYPCHGAGSACGKSIGDRRQSTIGNERLFNPALNTKRSRSEFVEWLLNDMPEPPRHYARLKKLNARGAPLRGAPPLLAPLSPSDLQARLSDVQLVDVRSILAFGGGHVPGSINIALRDEFPNWAGWMLKDERPIVLIAESSSEAHQAATHLYRIGLDEVAGFLRNGMTDWQNAGLPLEKTGEWTVHELNERRTDSDVLVLDVRTEQERKNGYVPGSQHAFVAHLEEELRDLDRNRTIATYCGTGYRASIAASVLQKAGFPRVVNVPGSWTAWKNASLPVQKP